MHDIHPAQMASQAAGWLRRVQHELDTIHLVRATCDEVSLLFEDEAKLNEWVMWAKGQDYEHIGSIERDRLSLRPRHQEAFDVRFEFIRYPELPWRIEAMCVLDGTAPLHETTLSKFGNGAVVHVSWKAAPNKDTAGYERHRRSLESGGPNLEKFTPIAEYENSYGRFCYYGDPSIPPFLKPRVNLRDTRVE